MKIKIIDADETSWYKHLVGKVRTAYIVDALPEMYRLRNYRTIFRGVKRIHAEIVQS